MYIERDIENLILANIHNNDVLFIGGSNQIGKTTILKRIKKRINKDKLSYYIDLEDNKKLEILRENPLNIFKIIGNNKVKAYIFIDSIHKLIDPIYFLKTLEKYENLKFIVSTSKNCINGYKKSSIFSLNTLSWKEFLRFKDESLYKIIFRDDILFNERNEILKSNKVEIDQIFNEYIKFGSYPFIILEKDYLKKEILLNELLNNILNTIILQNNLRDNIKIYKLLKILAENIGELLNVSLVAKTINVTSPTILNYLNILANANIITLLNPFSKKYSKEILKMTKCYFNDLGIANVISNNFNFIEERLDKDKFFKNIVFKIISQNGQNNKINFWQTQNKTWIDFIINEQVALDAKYNGRTFSLSKYKKFRKIYPEIELKMISYIPNGNESINVFNL